MKVHWLIGGVRYSEDSRILNMHNLASVRLRAGAAASATDCVKLSFGEICPNQSDVLVIGKIGANDISIREKKWLNQISKLKDAGAKIVLDYTDDHLSFPSAMTNFYVRALRLVDRCVTSSEVLRQSLTSKFDGDICVIDDAYEVPILPPRPMENTRDLNFLWFGHDTNLPYLIRFLQSVNTPSIGRSLFIQTTKTGKSLLEQSGLQHVSRLPFHLELWSSEAMIERAKLSHFCLIPSDKSCGRKRGASTNRLMTALALGLWPIVTVLPSYERFSKFFQNIDEVLGGKFTAEAGFTERIKTFQNRILPFYTMESTGGVWNKLFKSSTDAKRFRSQENELDV